MGKSKKALDEEEEHDEDQRESEEENDLYEAGTRVEANYRGEGKYYGGKIKRQHRNGTYTIEYDDGDVEKHVSTENIRLPKSSKSKSNKKGRSSSITSTLNQKVVNETLKEGDEVQVSEGSKWFGGTIDAVRQNGASYDIRYEEDDQVEKRVKASRVRKTLPPLEVKAKVKFVDDKNKEHTGEIVKVRKNCLYDIEHDSDDEIQSKEIDRYAIEPLKPSRKWGNALKLTSPSSSKETKSFDKNQRVQFEDSKGKTHAGKIIRVRDDGERYDIQHDSDEEQISTKINKDDIHAMSSMTAAASTFAKNIGKLTHKSKTSFAVDDKVSFQDEDKISHVGKITRVRSDNTYDIQHESDEEVVTKRIDIADIKAESTLRTLAPSKFLNRLTKSGFEKGMTIEFRLHRSKEWIEGQIFRVRENQTYDIEYVDSDGHEYTQKKVDKQDIRPLSNASHRDARARNDLKVGSVVEVQSKKGRNVHVATIKKVNEDTETFTVEYEDGSIEKRVDSSRVRISSTKLRIGVQVNMIIEDPSEGVSKAHGQIEWVHHNDKFVVRTDKDQRVFSRVARSSLFLPNDDPNEQEKAPGGVVLTQKELLGFVCNFVLEALVYVWFAFGLGVEISQGFEFFSMTSSDSLTNVNHMSQLFANPTRQACLATNPNLWSNGTLPGVVNHAVISPDAFNLDRIWLMGLLICLTLGWIGFLVVVGMIFKIKVQMIADLYIDAVERHYDLIYRRRASYLMLILLLLSSCTLLSYSSILNKFGYYCLWKDKTIHFALDNFAFKTDPFSSRVNADIDIVDLLLELCSKITLNLFRGSSLFIVLASGTHFLSRVLGILPAVALTCIMCLKLLATFHLLHYVQRVYIEQGIMQLNANIDVGIGVVVFTQWLNWTVLHTFLSLCEYDTMLVRFQEQGPIDEHALADAEEGRFGIQARDEAKLELEYQNQRNLGKWNLAILKLYEWVGIHAIAVIFCLIGNVKLNNVLSKDKDQSLEAGTIDLVMTISWLIIILMVPCGAYYIRSSHPLG